MPFDALTTRPSARLLSEILRGGTEHPLWPQDFVWDYSDCRACAMGMAHRLWSDVIPSPASLFANSQIIGERLGLSIGASFRIFCLLGNGQHTIKPHHVADAIDAYLEAYA